MMPIEKNFHKKIVPGYFLIVSPVTYFSLVSFKIGNSGL